METQSANSLGVAIPLYHGTSTLFLNSIIESGLGGRDLISGWKVLEFAKLRYPFAEEHLSRRDDFRVKCQSFKWIVEQKSAAMNFQHADTYLSPARSTAVRYAANHRYGSELLTYRLDLLQQLVCLGVDGVCNHLYRAYPRQVPIELARCPSPAIVRQTHARRSSRDHAAENAEQSPTGMLHVIAVRQNQKDIEDREPDDGNREEIDRH